MATRKLGIVQLLPALESGGVEQGTLEVANELVRRGHNSIVISAGGRLTERLTLAGSEHINWAIGKKSLNTLMYITKLRQLLIQRQVDILHARSRLPAWIAFAAWKSLPANRRPRFITTVHGLYSVKYYSSIMARGEAVIAVSDTVKRYILDNYPHTSPNSIHTIYRGVDTHRYYPDFRPSSAWTRKWYAEYPQTQGKKLLVLPGRLTRLKGHLDFLNILSGLRDAHSDLANNTHGLIVGGEDPKRREYARSLHESVTRLGLEEQVTFTGVRDDLREILSISQIAFSLSNHPESFGRTTLEALALGTPLIGYAHGGVGEILENLLPAGKIAPGDDEKLLSKTLDFLSKPPIPRTNNLYSTQLMLDQTIELYEIARDWP